MAQDVLARNNVTVLGNGSQTLLFAHGFGCDQNMWRFITPAFRDDFRIVLFDYVGSGKSDRTAYTTERYSSLQGYAQDVLEVCEALALTDVLFVGHSVSGMIGVLASLEKPELFKQLILVAPSPRYLNDPPGYEGGFEHDDVLELLDLMEKNYLGWASYLAPMAIGGLDKPELVEEMESSFCSTDPSITRQFAETTFFSDHRAQLPLVSVPSLILQCRNDAIAPIPVGKYLHHHMPHSTLRVMDAIGHCPHLSHPKEIICLIQEYLDRVTAGTLHNK